MVTLAPILANVSELDHLNPTHWAWLKRYMQFKAVSVFALPETHRDHSREFLVKYFRLNAGCMSYPALEDCVQDV